MARENFYILLDLDPAEHDPAHIEAVIVAKQREWALLRTHPSKGTWANGCLALIPLMRRAMGDEAQRKTEAEEAKRLLLTRQKEQFTDLDEALKLLATKGYVFEKELETLLKKESFKAFKLEEVKERIPVPLKKDAPEIEQDKTQPLDASIAKKIEENLQLTEKKDLYDFLGLQRNSSLGALQSKTADEYEKTRLTAKKDALLTATQELVGQCQSLFKDEGSRKRYDKTLDLQRFKSLDKLLEVAGMDGEIIASEFRHLVEEGTKLGIAKDEVIAHVKKIASSKKWSVQLPDAGSGLDQALNCGVCGALNAPKAIACSNCGYKLEENCPKCKTLNPSSARNCSKCGYATGDMPNALPLLRDAKDALAEGNFAEAEKLFTLANNYWEDHPHILAGRQKIREQSERVQIALKRAQDLAQQGEYYQAQTVLSEVKALPGGESQAAALGIMVTGKIAAAEKWLEKARIAAGLAEKENAYLQALDLCRDCREASEGLTRIPPEAPSGLSTTIQDQGVLLQWQPPASKVQLSYKVVRKIASLPAYATDGDILSDTTQLYFLDKTGQPGLSYYYAVFTIRGTVTSSKAAFSEPITKVAEVQNLSATPSDGSVTLRWQLPTNALRVEVWTKKGVPPSHRGDGVQLPSVRSDGASHNGLTNGETHGYLLVTIFKDGFGKELPSAGIKTLTEASAPPKPVEYMHVHKNGNLVELTWQEGADKVELFSAEQPFLFQFGEVFPYAQLGGVGTPVSVHQKGMTSVRMAQHGIRYLLPVTIKGDIAVVGRGTTVRHLEEVTGLDKKVEDDQLKLTWTFPPGATQAEVYCDDPDYPGRGIRYLVSERDYQRSGFYTVERLPENLPKVLIRVRTLLEAPGEDVIYSTGVETTVKVKKTNIRFQIRKNGLTSFFSGTYKFEVQVEVEGIFETNLQLVVKENNRLISFKDTDRTTIREFSANDFISNNVLQSVITYKPTNKGVKYLFFSLIPVNPEDKDHYRIEDNGKKVTL